MLEALIDSWGDGAVLFAGGFGVGLLFGACAQHSRFCLRAATIEFTGRRPGPRFAVWLIVFATAILSVQAGVMAGWIAPLETRQLGSPGSLSGALIGGLLFGVGMVLSRGCASRLLVLSATGNLRALVSGLIVTIVAQASLRGILSWPREALSGLWLVDPGPSRDLLTLAGAGPVAAVLLATVCLLAALAFARRTAVRRTEAAAAIGVGLAIALGWIFTFAMTRVSFEPLQPGSVTFTGPSADTLMGLINAPSLPLTFNVGLVPGVFTGSAIAALLTRTWQLTGFDGGASMLRYFAGACLMGFGAMLAGGCAVGAGVTGGSLFALTAWVALTAMWIGAVAANLIDRQVGETVASRTAHAQ